MADPILELRDLAAGYAKADILHGVSLEVHQGEMVCIIGPNGAGKTTTLRSIFGLTDIRRGQVILAGESVNKVRTYERVTKGIAFIPQENNVFPSLTVEVNLEMGFKPGKGSRLTDALESVYQQFPRLKERRKQRVGTLSGGERRMCAVGIGLMSSPKVLLLDEPSLGLAPIVVQQLFERIQEINRGGTTILLVEQNAKRALSIADRGYVLELGQVKHQGTGQGLANDPEVQRLYLGGGQ
jgi:ABC-type branched-subunit amino acid transport system ATPase component